MAEIPFVPIPVSGGAVKCGWYTGDNNSTRHIDLGVTPKWVAVWKNDGATGDSGYSYGGLAIREKECNALSVSDGGFDVKRLGNSHANDSGYYYIYLYGI